MSRTTTAPFNAALAAIVGATGYLVSIGFVPGSPDTTLRICDLGEAQFEGHTWFDMDFEVKGFRLALEGLGQGGGVTLSIQNLDGTMVALLLTNLVYDAPVVIRQIVRAAGSPSDTLLVADGDVPMLAEMVIDGVEIGLDFVHVALLPLSAAYTYAPNKRVDAAHDLANATPEGTQIAWGNEIYTVETFRG